MAQQHQHQQSPVICGAEHPELIPDSTVFRHWLLMASVVPNASNSDFVRQQAELSKLGITEPEKLKLLVILANFRGQYEALIQQHNDLAQAGKHPDINLLLQRRDELVNSAKADIQATLSSDSVTRIENLVKAHKSKIRIEASAH